MVVIDGLEYPGRRWKFRRQITDDRGGVHSALEGQEVNKRLERGTGGAGGPCAVDLTVDGVGIILRADQREDIAGAVFEHHHRAILNVLALQMVEVLPQAVFNKV